METTGGNGYLWRRGCTGGEPEEVFDYQSGAFAYVYGDGECK